MSVSQDNVQVQYFTPVSDAEVPSRFKETCTKYRCLATEWRVPATTVVCYRVKAGFTVRDHAPKSGPCHNGFSHLKGWNFPDEPTRDCLVFWIPRLVPESTSKTRDQQLALLGEIRQMMDLPAHHMTTLGNVALDSGLILAHHKATSQRIPHNFLWIRTDTCGAGDRRINLGFLVYGLDCSYWNSDEAPLRGLGVFALGVEDLGS